MSRCRHEILAACYAELGEAERNERFANYVDEFFDEMLRAIRRDSGIPDSPSSLPDSSETAARFGADSQRAGLPVTEIPVIFAAISQALGNTGEKYELSISAEEYKLLHRCLDAGIATSIENFWRRDKERENRLITERFGFMAHELRNALGNANLAYKLLRAGALDVNGHTAEVLGRNLIRMEALVAQCLGSVQLEVGVSLDLKPVHVASVLRDLEASSIPDRGVAISLQLDESLFIAADEMLLTSAVGNLLHNAVKFSPVEGRVYLRARASDGHALIEVEDEGGGLKHQSPEELFEPFVKRREGNSHGTGLGLSIA
ncbi:MAG TPA: HAMP domain-containing sensor histidine kinase, partial [Polyangiaceae bacterium]|nr:HAMP domain-containing sensor histidine kinase [Polyangiaceae bacterium]